MIFHVFSTSWTLHVAFICNVMNSSHFRPWNMLNVHVAIYQSISILNNLFTLLKHNRHIYIWAIHRFYVTHILKLCLIVSLKKINSISENQLTVSNFTSCCKCHALHDMFRFRLIIKAFVWLAPCNRLQTNHVPSQSQFVLNGGWRWGLVWGNESIMLLNSNFLMIG